MHQISQTTCPAANNKRPDVEEITVDLYPFLREYKGGRIERFVRSPFVAASEDAAASHGVATRDVVVDEITGVSARLFLPSLRDSDCDERQRLPVIMYVHGGSFCTGSAFCRMYHAYARSLAARTGARLTFVEVVCSDPAEHRRRIEGRTPDWPGQGDPTWYDVVSRAWEPFSVPRLLVDNLGDPEQHARRVLDALSGRPDQILGLPDPGTGRIPRVEPTTGPLGVRVPGQPSPGRDVIGRSRKSGSQDGTPEIRNNR
jgi:hypothetical protein